MGRVAWMAKASAVALLGVAAVVGLRARRANAATMTIDHGGTYSGVWESDDADTPCVRITTDEPVTIENATLRGPGNLIFSRAHQAKITVRNTTGVGVKPNAAGRAVGRFAEIERFASVTIENCAMDNTAGVYLLDYEGDRSDKQTVKILRNRAHNIDGRASDGKGGFSGKESLVQFAQLDKVRHAAGIEIAWNEVINDPGQSCVEDNISIYLSSGTKESPIRIHDNFIRGAYATNPLKGEYSGGGIMLADGVAKDGPDGDSAFVVAERNQVLDTTNHGIAISAGHDCAIIANRIVSAGVLADGKPIGAQNVGAYIWDSYKAGDKRFYRNSGQDNLIGWMKGDERNDAWCPDAESWTGTTPWKGPITRDTYNGESRFWQQKLKSAGVTIGPNQAATTAPTSAPAK